MSYDENKISDLIDWGIQQEKEKREIFERLVNSHFNLFRRLNQINNKETQSESTQKALLEAEEINEYFANKISPRIVQT